MITTSNQKIQYFRGAWNNTPSHGTATVQSIVNIALLRGMIGKKHAGLMPIRGHSNVQGIGSMGATPKLKEFSTIGKVRFLYPKNERI